jgi:plastocyanin
MRVPRLALPACLAGVVLVVAGFSVTGPVAGQPLSSGAFGPRGGKQVTTNVTVHMTEFQFALSQSEVPVGRVVFTVINDGDETHDFQIAGSKTPLLARGQRATLTVNFTQPGSFNYICTVGEHAINGMTGFLAVVGQGQTTTPTPTPTATYRVTLSEFRIRIRNSSGRLVSSLRPGTVRFNVTNVGRLPHNFVINRRQTPVLRRNGRATLIVTFGRGSFRYICSIAGHPAAGMRGTLRVGPAATPRPRATYGVTLSEFKIRIRNSRGRLVSSIRRGTVRFNVRNIGRLGHNFVINRKRTPVLRRNGRATFIVTLRKGRYRYICSVAGHPAAGMRGFLRVT